MQFFDQYRQHGNVVTSVKNDIEKPAYALVDNRPQTLIQRQIIQTVFDKFNGKPVQKKSNDTGLPDNLKSGIENLSGHSMDDVKVHYNSSQPAQLNAHAYAQGTDIHVAPGQESHLPHEAWHVIQQKQGRVKPTMQMKGKVNINDDVGLEKEADVMGAKALQLKATNSKPFLTKRTLTRQVVQGFFRYVGGLIGGAAGSLAGAAAGTLQGGYEGYHEAGGLRGVVGRGLRGDFSGLGNVWGGAVAGFKHGRDEGWEQPLVGLGELAGVGGAVVGGAIKGVRGVLVGGYRGIRGRGVRGAIPGAIIGGSIGINQGSQEGYEHPALPLAIAVGSAVAGPAIGAIAGSTGSILGQVATGAASGHVINHLADLQANVPGNKKSTRTHIHYTPGFIELVGFKGAGIRTNHVVGKKMEAHLNPLEPVQGSATDANWTWMQFLRHQPRYSKANIVRGHLLNHDLGGFGVPQNLYPISTKANAEHSAKVEQKVKHLLAAEIIGGGRPINYSVTVADHAHDPSEATFNCQYGIEGQALSPIIPIESSFGHTGGFGGGKKDNPLAGTGWHHDRRQGAMEGDQRSYRNYLGGSITETTTDVDHVLFEQNVKAEYKHGSGLTKEAVQLRIENMGRHRVFRGIPGRVQTAIVVKMGFGRRRDFYSGLVEFLMATQEYQDIQDNEYNDLKLEALVKNILQEKIDEVKADGNLPARTRREAQEARL